jgi:hypothetical protein
MKRTISRRLETVEQRGDRLRLELELKRKDRAAEESAVDRMIRENIRLHGA